MIDTTEMIDCAVNTTKSSIVFELQQRGKCTAKEILSANANITQATLYRILNKLVKAGIIYVVDENKVRSRTEKVYALSDDFNAISEKLVSENNLEMYLGLFTKFVMGLIGEFKEYTDNPNADLGCYNSGFSAAPIYATQEQLSEIGNQINEIVRPYQTQQSQDQQLHTLAVIITPPKE